MGWIAMDYFYTYFIVKGEYSKYDNSVTVNACDFCKQGKYSSCFERKGLLRTDPHYYLNCDCSVSKSFTKS